MEFIKLLYKKITSYIKGIIKSLYKNRIFLALVLIALGVLNKAPQIVPGECQIINGKSFLVVYYYSIETDYKCINLKAENDIKSMTLKNAEEIRRLNLISENKIEEIRENAIKDVFKISVSGLEKGSSNMNTMATAINDIYKDNKRLKPKEKKAPQSNE